jgi:hypothetical protein
VTTTDADWEQRVAQLGASFDKLPPADFRAAVQALADERPPGDAAALSRHLRRYNRSLARYATDLTPGT